MPDSKTGGGGTCRHVQLGEDGGHVGAGGAVTDEKSVGDLAVGDALGEQTEDVKLAVRQPMSRLSKRGCRNVLRECDRLADGVSKWLRSSRCPGRGEEIRRTVERGPLRRRAPATFCQLGMFSTPRRSRSPSDAPKRRAACSGLSIASATVPNRSRFMQRSFGSLPSAGESGFRRACRRHDGNRQVQ